MSTAAGTRTRRRQAIVELVSGERLGSQEEIRSRLAQLGHQATQSTISRDLEELGLARVHDAEGVRYVMPEAGTGTPSSARLRRLLAEFAVAFVRTDVGRYDPRRRGTIGKESLHARRSECRGGHDRHLDEYGFGCPHVDVG